LKPESHGFSGAEPWEWLNQISLTVECVMPRLNFDVSPELDETIEKLVKQTGSASKSEVLRRAIALMEVAAEAKQEGRKIVIAEKDRTPVAEVII
jgi:Arc/MetJ-type ribon-helix-helix transcriptional regulator